MKPNVPVKNPILKAVFLMRVRRHGNPPITIDGTVALFIGHLASGVFTTPIELKKSVIYNGRRALLVELKNQTLS